MLYIVILLLLILLSYNYDFLQKKQGKYAWYSIVLIIFVLVAGLRYRVSLDTIRYMASFQKMPDLFDIGSVDFDSENYDNTFVSSSIDDAGPSMVNQSIMCGTTVLSFDIGSALYMIDNGETGYRVPLKDVDAMETCLAAHFNLGNEERKVMQNKCRRKGVKTGARCEFAKTLVSFAGKLPKYERTHL